jgi:hypothetical protein
MLVFFTSAQKRGHSEKSRCLKLFGILVIRVLLKNYGHLINVKDSFHLRPKIVGILKISSCFKKQLGSLRCFCPINSGRL